MAALCRSPAFSSAVAYAARYRAKGDSPKRSSPSTKGRTCLRGCLRGIYGKSLRYQLLLFLFDFKLGRTRAIATERSVALVISPLVSLMVYQVCSLPAHGVYAAILI